MHGFVQINLPVHQAAGYQEFLNRIDALLLHNQLIVNNFEHFNDAVGVDNAFGHTGEKTIAAQIVETVDIELARDQLRQIFLRINASEYFNCGIEFTTHLLVQFLHENQ